MLRTRRGRQATTLCVAALALLPFALWWRVTLLEGVFAEGDLYSYNFPLLMTIARQWLSGEIPLWNPYVFGGAPLLGNMQGGVFYPLNALLLIGSGWRAYQYSILLHYSLAGVFTFVYLRTLPLSRVPSLFGGLAFMLCGFAAGTLGHVSTLRTFPWLPLALAGFEMWRRRLDGRYALLAGAALGLMLVAGHPQIPLYSLALCVAYAGFFFSRARGAARARLAAGCLSAFLVAGGLAAVQLLPTLQLATQEYLRPTDRSYEYFVKFSLSPALLVNLVFPRFLPTDESELAVYVGISTLVLAFIGAWRGAARHTGHRIFFSSGAVVALLLALGRWSHFSRQLFRLPLYNLFTSPGRNLFEVHFCLAVLSALGLQATLALQAESRHRRRAVVLFLLLAIPAMLAVYRSRTAGVLWDADLSAMGDPDWVRETVLPRLPILLASLGAMWVPISRWRSMGALALTAVLAVDLGTYATGVYGLQPPSVYAARPPVVDFLAGAPRRGRIVTLEAPGDDETRRRAMVAPNANAIYGVESVNGFDSMMLRQVDVASGHVMPTYGLVAGPNSYATAQFRRFMDLLAVAYVVTPSNRTLDLPAPRYRRVYQDEQVRVFENTEALPRFFFVPRPIAVRSGEAVVALSEGSVHGEPLDPRSSVLVEASDDDLGVRSGDARATAELVVDQARAGSALLRVNCPAPGLLVHAASYSEGWRARVDGAPVRVFRVNGLVQGIPVPAGRHQVLIEYRPRAFLAGALLSLASLIGVAGALWVMGRRADSSDAEAATGSRGASPGSSGTMTSA
jgi:Bacterial membrane protein YfhO